MKDPEIHVCACKYCNNKTKSQKEITASMSNILRSSPATSSPTYNRPKLSREKQPRDPIMRLREHRPREKVYAAIQRALVPLKPSANVLKQAMLVERNNDLRAIHSKSTMTLRRWFREGEVVWCALPRFIVAPAAEKVSIQFWPAVVEEVLLKAKAIPRERGLNPSTSGHGLPLASSSAVQLDNTEEEDGRGIVLESNDDPLYYTVNQWTRYKVRFLAVSHSCNIDDVDVLPYQAYMPPDELISFMSQIPPNELNFERELLTRFNPCPGDLTPSFSDAASPFAMALQIASTLSSFWSLTDEYQMKYVVPPSARPLLPPPVPSPVPGPQHLSLQSAIEAAGRHNAQLSTDSMTLNSAYYRNVSGTNPEMSQAELQKTSIQILGIPTQSEHFSQTRFQGLWWGTERIWVDDFVRLKVPRRSLAPEGAANIYPPAGAGKKRLEECLSDNRNPDEFTAGTRGIFMKLEGLFVADIPRDDGTSGTKKAARACGALYEIVEEDWEDPKDAKPVEAPSQSQQNAGPFQAGPSSSMTPAPSINGTQQSQPGGTVSWTAVQTPSLPSPNPGPVQVNLLPAAPIGFKFRLITEPDYQIVVELGLISGRYYPRILSHPKVVPAVQAAFDRPIEQGGVSSGNNLWALEGLSGGYHNSVDPHKYKRSRVGMMQDADRESLIQLQAYRKDKLEGMNGGIDEDDSMDIDEMYA
jgi:Transcription-silencing protein Clr2